MDYIEAREKYNPTRIGLPIEVLWIAESPPVAGGYFYFEKPSGKGHFFRETMKALGWWDEKLWMQSGLDKKSFLRKFQESGFFLLDLSDNPVNGLSRSERKKALQDSLPGLLKEVTRLAPKRILIIKRNVFDIACASLSELEYTVLNKKPIPFPSNHWQAEYRRLVRYYIPVTKR